MAKSREESLYTGRPHPLRLLDRDATPRSFKAFDPFEPSRDN